jgi:anti-sigma B factor antagonist
MEIRERAVGSVTILDLNGKFVRGDGDSLLKDKVNSLLVQGRRHVLLNLGGVSYIDSTGLGEIVASYAAVGRQGGQIKLLNLTRRVQDLLAIAKLLTVFESFDSEAEAIKSFPPPVGA